MAGKVTERTSPHARARLRRQSRLEHFGAARGIRGRKNSSFRKRRHFFSARREKYARTNWLRRRDVRSRRDGKAFHFQANARTFGKRRVRRNFRRRKIRRCVRRIGFACRRHWRSRCMPRNAKTILRVFKRISRRCGTSQKNRACGKQDGLSGNFRGKCEQRRRLIFSAMFAENCGKANARF